MGSLLSILAIVFGLVLMVLGVFLFYAIVKAAVKNGVLAALDESRATHGVHRIVTQIYGSQPPQRY